MTMDLLKLNKDFGFQNFKERFWISKFILKSLIIKNSNYEYLVLTFYAKLGYIKTKQTNKQKL